LISIAGNPSNTLKSVAESKPTRSEKASNTATKEVSKEAVDEQKQPKTICSVDFGTTHSGVGLVGSVNSRLGDIEVIHDWIDGGLRNDYVEKVPSRLAYPDENAGLGKITFGFEVTSSMKSYTWMKLYLAGNVDKGDFIDPDLGGKAGHGMLELPPEKTAEDVVTDYLRCLYQYIMGRLAREIPEALLATRPIEFWLTTPACWDNQANQLTRECAMRAGFGTRVKDELCIVGEPEAALLANLATSIDKHEGIYKVRGSVYRPLVLLGCSVLTII
jgi:molecular chaperone DnaK (HSP70)